MWSLSHVLFHFWSTRRRHCPVSCSVRRFLAVRCSVSPIFGCLLVPPVPSTCPAYPVPFGFVSVPFRPIPLHPVLSHPMLFNSIPFHPIQFHKLYSISSHPHPHPHSHSISSCPVPSRPVPSHPTPSDPIPSRCRPSSFRAASCRVCRWVATSVSTLRLAPCLAWRLLAAHVPCRAVPGWAGLGWTGLDWAGLGCVDGDATGALPPTS